MAYLLDANVFIQAKNLHYGLDFCPAFWEWLIAGNQAKRVFSIEKISDEIAAGDDELSEWAAERGDGFFLNPDPSMLPVLGSVSSWIANQRFEQAAIATFSQIADYYLVAHALSHGDTTVTHEVPSDSRKKIKIPNVCIGLSIKCMSPYEMLRRERALFILGSRK